MDTTATGEKPVRRADYGRGMDAKAESIRLAGNRQPDVSVLSSGQSFTVQEALARILAGGIRQEALLETQNALLLRIATALESQPGKPRGA